MTISTLLFMLVPSVAVDKGTYHVIDDDDDHINAQWYGVVDHYDHLVDQKDSAKPTVLNSSLSPTTSLSCFQQCQEKCGHVNSKSMRI